ncbi:phospholipase [Deefgea rivuli]|uniref:phospholipase n=1 Tax=Deefgea rivuli TaxID=400948 RepID=UPI00146F942A|nr:phospholipase [Deefgea rivuli]
MTSVSAPGWNSVGRNTTTRSSIPKQNESKSIELSEAFSEPKVGNKVEFFSTGAQYFSNVQAAIEGATSCVFIAGWQVNFDVELTPGKTLLDALSKALKNGADVYVMPWQNVPGAVETGAMTTALAIGLLNGLLGIKGRAWCLTAPAQSDQGVGNVMFSHHQKSVVIDNKIAYCGGIDLAYGRRDDEQFTLKANGRSGNELYNSCIPAIHTSSRTELQNCVTPLELLAAIGTTGTTRSISTFLTSPSEGILAWALDKREEVTKPISETIEDVQDWWSNTSLMEPLIDAIQDQAIDFVQTEVRNTQSDLKARLAHLAAVNGANASSVSSALAAWLAGQPIHSLPPKIADELNQVVKALLWLISVQINANGWRPSENYERLFKKETRAMPMYGTVLDPKIQPRMPWQDVHSRIEGPSVYDLSRNFTERWNATAYQLETESVTYRRALSALTGNKFAAASLPKLLKTLGIRVPAKSTLPRINAKHILKAPAEAAGGCSVQVMRSASKQMLNLEAAAKGIKGAKASLPQNNCLRAMLKVISSAQHFIYIEGQFFQTDHGHDGAVQAGLSGPMASLLQLERTPEYLKFKNMLGIRGTSPSAIFASIDWTKANDVMRMAQGPEFMLDLDTVLKNLATREGLTQPTAPQKELINPIGHALVERITRVGIQDGLPFHVYIVLPVHPEGTLNTLNIMSQVHLTMHSLVFGEHSLLNGVRRAILIKKVRARDKCVWDVAEAKVKAMKLEQIIRAVPDDWTQFITLLNLRNWDELNGQPVTEQIYVHSKLLIADDQAAVLGSANINDRSMLGDRDSELTVLITSRNSVKVPLAGPMQSVAKEVHELRVALWKKHFGAGTPGRQATELLSDAILKSPGLPSTWKAIQNQASKNATIYNNSFWYIPRSEAHLEIQRKEVADKAPGGAPSSIWPTWHYQTYLDHAKNGRLLYRMPFDPLFWRAAEHREIANSWNLAIDAKQSKVPTTKPQGVRGFIVALPTEWTRGEDNLFSKTHIATIAAIDAPLNNDTALARADKATSEGFV